MSGLAVTNIILASLASLVVCLAALRNFTKGYVERKVSEAEATDLVRKVIRHVKVIERELGIRADWEDD